MSILCSRAGVLLTQLSEYRRRGRDRRPSCLSASSLPQSSSRKQKWFRLSRPRSCHLHYRPRPATSRVSGGLADVKTRPCRMLLLQGMVKNVSNFIYSFSPVVLTIETVPQTTKKHPNQYTYRAKSGGNAQNRRAPQSGGGTKPRHDFHARAWDTSECELE